MTRALQAQRRAPHSGETRFKMILLHGFGATGADTTAPPNAVMGPRRFFSSGVRVYGGA